MIPDVGTQLIEDILSRLKESRNEGVKALLVKANGITVDEWNGSGSPFVADVTKSSQTPLHTRSPLSESLWNRWRKKVQDSNNTTKTS